jgi:hypothetical protein
VAENLKAEVFKDMSQDVRAVLAFIHKCVRALAAAEVATTTAKPTYRNLVPHEWGLALTFRYNWGGLESVNAAHRVLAKCGVKFHPMSKHAKDPYRRAGRGPGSGDARVKVNLGRVGRDGSGVRFDLIWRCVPLKQPFDESDPRPRAWQAITKELGESRLNQVVDKLGADRPKGAKP